MSSSNDIRERTRDWVDAGIIDPAQAARIGEFEAARDASPAPTARARMQALFGVFGGLLVGLGVLLSVASNWHEIADPLKVAIMVGSMVLAYALGLVADARGAPRWAGTVAWVVGLGLFAGGLVVIGLVYNVDAHEPLAALLVALVGSALALLVRRLAVGWVAMLALGVWIVAEVIDSLPTIDDDRTVFVLLGAVVLAGVAMLAQGFALEQVHVLALPARIVALGGMLLALVQASFAWHMETSPGSDAPGPAQLVTLVAAVLGVAAMLRWSRLEHRRAVAAALLVAGAAAFTASIVQHDLVVAIVASALLALGGIGLVLLGLVESRSDLFALGIVWLVVLVVTRYLDFVFAVELGGPGFIGAGLLLLAIAWLVGRSRRLWSRREEVLA